MLALRTRRLATSEVEEWFRRFDGVTASSTPDASPPSATLSPGCLIPIGLMAIAYAAPMVYVASLRGRGQSAEGCKPALAAEAFAEWVSLGLRERLEHYPPGVGEAWGNAVAWTYLSFAETYTDLEAAGAYLSVCLTPVLAAALKRGSVDAADAVAVAVQAALWANWGAASYVEGIEAMSRLGPFAAPAMSAAGMLLGMRFKRESIPSTWIEALPGIAQFETALRRVLGEPAGPGA